MESRPVSSEAKLLQKSAFALGLVGTFITLMVTIRLFGIDNRSRFIVAVTVACGAFFALNLGVLAFLLFSPLQRTERVAGRVTRLLAHPRAALVFSLLLVVGLMFMLEAMGYYVTSLLVPAALFTVTWSAILVVVLAISNGGTISRFLTRAHRFWLGFGAASAITLVVLVIFQSTNVFFNTTLLKTDFLIARSASPMTFYGGTNDPDLLLAYFRALTLLETQWVPYTYGREKPVTGLITVDSAGQRATAAYVDANVPAPTVAFFGGSTMWGTGSRDDYTIPSQVARRLHEANTPIHAINYGQSGYVTTQDLIMFGRQLALGRVPDAAVFYGGFNDVLSVYQNANYAGLPLNEARRVLEVENSLLLRKGHLLLSMTFPSLGAVDMSLVGIPDASAEQVAALYFENMRQIRMYAREYGVRVLFVWQPMLLYKQHLSDLEQRLMNDDLRVKDSYVELYEAVDREIRRRAAEDDLTDFLILSDLFADDPRPLFIDRVHVTEDANDAIAGAIVPALAPLLDEPAD